MCEGGPTDTQPERHMVVTERILVPNADTEGRAEVVQLYLSRTKSKG